MPKRSAAVDVYFRDATTARLGVCVEVAKQLVAQGKAHWFGENRIRLFAVQDGANAPARKGNWKDRLLTDLVWKLSGGCCAYCGVSKESAIAIGARLTVDHIVPRSMGGPDELWNLVAACGKCNSSKGNRATGYMPFDRIRQRMDSMTNRLVGIDKEQFL